MRVFLAFLFMFFLIGGTRWAEYLERRSVLLFGICFVVASSFYSYRVLR